MPIFYLKSNLIRNNKRILEKREKLEVRPLDLKGLEKEVMKLVEVRPQPLASYLSWFF